MCPAKLSGCRGQFILQISASICPDRLHFREGTAGTVEVRRLATVEQRLEILGTRLIVTGKNFHRDKIADARDRHSDTGEHGDDLRSGHDFGFGARRSEQQVDHLGRMTRGVQADSCQTAGNLMLEDCEEPITSAEEIEDQGFAGPIIYTRNGKIDILGESRLRQGTHRQATYQTESHTLLLQVRLDLEQKISEIFQGWVSLSGRQTRWVGIGWYCTQAVSRSSI